MAKESIADERSIDTVIRGFTDAELALREVAGAVERIRSASEQLDASKADQAAARDALVETSTAVVTLGRQVEASLHALTDVRATLASIEPERLWQRLDDQSLALRDTAEMLSAQDKRIRRTTNLVWLGLAIGVATLAVLGAMVIGLLPIE